MKIISKVKDFIVNFFKRSAKLKPLWHIYDKLGIRLIYEKFIPPIEKKDYRRPSSLILWIIGIYSAIFGIASTRYESYINKIDTHANFVIAQLGTPNYKKALEQIPDIQSRKAPFEPDLFKPLSIFYSFMESKDTTYNEIIERMKGIIVIWKDSLYDVDLTNVHLENAFLMDANLEKADLKNAHLENADLRGAHLDSAYLFKVNLKNANLWRIKLNNAILTNSNLYNIRLNSTYPESKETTIDEIDFINELKNADNISELKLDDKIMKLYKDELEKDRNINLKNGFTFIKSTSVQRFRYHKKSK